MLPALYEISSEYRNASDRLVDLQLDEQTIADTLESLSGDLEAKCQNVAFIIRNMESLAEQIKQAEQQMATRRKAIENRAENIRNYLLRNMELCEISKIETPWFKISIRQNPASVVVDCDALIPAEFMRQPEPPAPTPDKKMIKSAIESGIEVPGVHLEKTTRIEIK